RAAVAMYVAKKSGGVFAVYSPEHEGQTLRQSGLAGDLRRSMTQGELVLHYQPIVLLPAHTTYALEALVRWNHPREGLLPPDRFISLAEDTNVIRPLTSWVLDTALARLCELGLQLSLDDFGTGYSPRIYLKRLPIHEIKVDRSFVKTLPGDPDAAAIVKAAVGLGHSLGLRVIAEGVEDRDAEGMLIEAGVDAAQGYFIGRAAPEDEMTSLLESGREMTATAGQVGPPALPPEREGSREG